MMLDVLLQLVLELARALIVDELSGKIRRRVRRSVNHRGGRDCGRALLAVHRANRERLFNRLLTAPHEDL